MFDDFSFTWFSVDIFCFQVSRLHNWENFHILQSRTFLFWYCSSGDLIDFDGIRVCYILRFYSNCYGLEKRLQGKLCAFLFYKLYFESIQRSYPPSLLNLICISHLKLERFQHLQHSDGQGVAGGVVGEAHLKFCDGDGSSSWLWGWSWSRRSSWPLWWKRSWWWSWLRRSWWWSWLRRSWWWCSPKARPTSPWLEGAESARTGALWQSRPVGAYFRLTMGACISYKRIRQLYKLRAIDY